MKTIQQLQAVMKPIGHGHGIAPVDFLTVVRDTIKSLPDVMFDRNTADHDIYAVLSSKVALKVYLTSITMRRALMAAALTCIAGDEADWKWLTGRDTTAGAQTPDQMEAGVFQASNDSRRLAKSLDIYLRQHSINTAQQFQEEMKSDHTLAVTYAILLLRVTTSWDGPTNRGWVTEQVTPALVDAWAEALMDAA